MGDLIPFPQDRPCRRIIHRRTPATVTDITTIRYNARLTELVDRYEALRERQATRVPARDENGRRVIRREAL